MKPVHIVILLLAGALGGATIMKFAHQLRPAIPTVTVARVEQTPVATTAPPVQPAVVEAAPPPPPIPEKAIPERKAAPKLVAHEIRRPSPFSPVTPPADDPEPVEQPVADPGPSFTSPIAAPPPVNAEPEHATPAPPAPRQPHQVTLNAGLSLTVRLIDGLSSERNVPGDAFHAALDKELVVDGFVIAERGARVEGQVVAADRGGNARGSAALALALTRLHTSDGQSVAIDTDSFFKHADPARGGDTAAKIGGGAVIGAVIGAIAGGGKGAAIGAGVGAGAGGGAVLLTRGKVDLPSESLVPFRLKTPVPLTEQLR